MGSRVRVSSSISAASAVARVVMSDEGVGVAGVHRLDVVGHFLDFFGAGCRGHECEL